MSDEVDQANDYAQFMLDMKLREMMAPKKCGPEICDCGEEIPAARREMGFQVCVDCAREAEVRSKTVGCP